MTDYLFYPGCALEASSTHYAKSARSVCQRLGIGLVDLDDWSCCGATAYVGTDEDKSVAYSTRNLALAERTGATQLVTACSGCYVQLRKANRCFNGGPQVRDRVSRALAAAGLSYGGTVRVRHLADVLLNDVGPDAIARSVEVSLRGLRVAPYHGCQISRPFDDIAHAEQPTILNELLAPTEAELVPFPLTARCCGGMLMTTRVDVALPMAGRLLASARSAGADCVAVACPLCSVNLEAYQDRILREDGRGEPMPVVLFTQLLGLAVGAPMESLGLDQCLVDVHPMLGAYV